MKNKIIAAAVAMVLILICFVPVILSFSRERDSEYEIVCFGDSVMACFYGWGAVPWFIEDLTGRKTLNAAFGGLSMSEPAEARQAGEIGFLYSMAELSKALVNKDFSLQIMGSAPKNEEHPAEWCAITKALDTLDYDKVKYVIIEHGVNDYFVGAEIDDTSNPYNIYTFAGALRTVIENVQKVMPGATLVLVTPTYNHLDYMDEDCCEADFGGGTLPEYVAKEKEVAAEYGLICVDNFNGSGINKDTYKEYLFDGLHSHQAGNSLIAENIVRNVEGIKKDEVTP